tara:strand:+ start:4755 stop:5504 length:750 start_codon:yes stop_codon:yes gene_type:complete
MGFNLNDYEMVEDRLKVFWADYPNGRIETNIVHITDDGTCVSIKAELYTDTKTALPVATGLAQETKGQGGPVNKDAWLENCETSAIGRALANWKYQGKDKKRPSREEMSKVSGKTSEAVKSKPKKETKPVAGSPVKAISEAGYGDVKGDKHPSGELAIDDTGLLCPCGGSVKYFTDAEKTTQRSPDFRCTLMGNCTAGDTVDGKVFAKSWWMDNKATPKSWQDYASVSNGMTLPKPKSLDEIGPDDAPF